MSSLENSHTFWYPTRYKSLTTETPPKKRLKNGKTLKKALKDDVKAKSAQIHYFYPNIWISELNFLFLDASQHIITYTLKTAFLTFFNMDFFHFFREQTQKMPWIVKNWLPWKVLILVDTPQGVHLRLPRNPKNARKMWKNTQKSLKMRI